MTIPAGMLTEKVTLHPIGGVAFTRSAALRVPGDSGETLDPGAAASFSVVRFTVRRDTATRGIKPKDTLTHNGVKYTITGTHDRKRDMEVRLEAQRVEIR